jgi:hypothetical protein
MARTLLFMASTSLPYAVTIFIVSLGHSESLFSYAAIQLP